MLSKKKFFGKLKQVPEIRTEEAENGAGGTAASPTSPVGLIPVIKADDCGAAIDDLPVGSVQGAAGGGGGSPSPTSPQRLTAAVSDDGSAASSISPDSVAAAAGGSCATVARERKVSLDITGPLQSPSPSVDRLSVSFSPDLGGDFSSDNMAADPNADAKVRFSKDHLSALSPDDEDDDDYSESLDAIMRRRESGRRRSIRRSPKRGSSPFGSDSESGGKGRRRSSTMTSTSCEETQVSIEEPEMTEEQMFESIRLHKELIEQMKKQPWKMKKRLKIVRKAKAYVRKHEGELEQRLAQSKNTKDMMARYNLIFLRYWERLKREGANLAKNLIPWEMRIKRIESHFGSVVASYFIFLRWVFWINIVMSIFISCFVIIPEVLAADRAHAGDRKELMSDEAATAFNLQTLWDFEGFLKYSPIFYGYYTNKDKTREGYRIPFAYFMTLLGMYGYSFAAILRRMAENTRLSKLSDQDEDCIFTWKLFTGWDYMIGHPETADNKVASLIMGFKENILEEREKKKEERNWKIVGLRVLANILVMILLASSAYAVVLVVQRSQAPDADNSWWRQNEVTVVVSMISIIFPNLFDLIGLMESNHPRTQLQWQLARIMLLYLLNLYTLIFALFSKVNDMSVELEALRPNTTVTPVTTTTSTMATMMTTTSTMATLMTTLPIWSNRRWSLPPNRTFWPLFNMSVEEQLPLPGDPLTALVEALNLSSYYHEFWPWNDTCLAVRIHCDTKRYYMDPYNDSFSTPASSTPPSWDYDQDLDSVPGIINASFLYSTATPLYNATLGSGLLANVTEIWNYNLSLPLMVNWSLPKALPRVYLPHELLVKFNLSLPATPSANDYDSLAPHAEALSASTPRAPTSLPLWDSSTRQSRPTTTRKPDKKKDRGRGRNRTSDAVSNPTSTPLTTATRRTRYQPAGVTASGDSTVRFTRATRTRDKSSSSSQTTAWSDSGSDATASTLENNVTTTSPSWNDTEELMDAPYYSTPYPKYEEIGCVNLAPGYCAAIKCLDPSHFENSATPTQSYFDYENFTTDESLEGVGSSTSPSANEYPDTTQFVDVNATKEDPGPYGYTNSEGLDIATRTKLRKLCWETMFGQELIKLTIMDLVLTTISILITDFFRALFVRVMNHCWCWDLEKQFPGYGDFKIAENILHLVNNQGMIWMGMFFSPGIPGLNMVKIVILMYIRSWAVLTCNIPHETVFKASSSSNFYYTLLLMMLFLCTLPVGYAIVWLAPSWHCGPFSQYNKIYRIFTSSLETILPNIIIRALDYAASPGIIIPLLVLLILVIYYLNSVANSLRDANKDLKDQLRRERTEERRKVFQMADARHDPPNSASKWMVMKKILPVLPSKVKMLQVATRELKAHTHELRPVVKEDDKKSKKQISEDENSDAVIADALKANSVKLPKDKNITGVHKVNKEENKENDKVPHRIDEEGNGKPESKSKSQESGEMQTIKESGKEGKNGKQSKKSASGDDDKKSSNEDAPE